MAQTIKRRSAPGKIQSAVGEKATPKGLPPTNGDITLVVGMHRSGTSLLANILQYLGCDMVDGAPHKNEWNLNGYWERQDFTDLQDKILTEVGAPWGSAGHALPFTGNWWRSPTLKPLKLRLKEELAQQYEGRSGHWGFKDPRTTRLIPVWREICAELGLTPKFVLAFRDPTSSITSLIKRDGFSQEYAETLWLTYNFEALSTLGFDASAIVSYEEWFKQPIDQALALIKDLELTPDFGSDAELQPMLQGIIAPDLRHFLPDQKSLLQVGALASETYSALKTFHDGGRERLQGLAEEFRGAQRTMLGWASECRRLSDSLADVQAQKEKIQDELDRVNRRIEDDSTKITQLRNEFEECKRNVDAKHKTIVDVAAHRDLLVKEVAVLKHDVVALREQVTTLTEERDSVRKTLADREARSSEVEAKLTAAQQSVATLVQERDKAATETHRLSDQVGLLTRALNEEKTQSAVIVAERDTLKAEGESLRKSAEALQAKLSSRDSELDLAYEEINQTRADLADAEERGIAEAARRFEQERVEWMREAADKDDKNARLRAELDKTEVDLKTERDEKAALSIQLEETRARAMAQATTIEQQREEFARRHDQAQSEWIVREEILCKELSTYAERQSAWLDERDDLIERAEWLDANLTETQIQIGSLTEQINELSRQGAQRDEALGETSEQLAKVRRALGELQAEHDSLTQRHQSAQQHAADANRAVTNMVERARLQAEAVTENRARSLHPGICNPGTQESAQRLQCLWSMLDPDPEKARCLFDDAFYVATYPDIAAAGVDPFDHYNADGWREGRDPNICFSTSGYLALNPDVRAAEINPLLHYWLLGGKEGRRTGGLFDNAFYASANPDVIGAGLNPLEHFIRYGLAEGRPNGRTEDLLRFKAEGDDLLSPMDRVRQVMVRFSTAIEQFELIELQVSNTPVLTIALRAGADMPMLAAALHFLAVCPPGVDFEVMVLDEGFMPGINLVQSKWRGVRIHRLTRDGGWGTAMNALIAAASGTYIALLAPEIRPQDGWAHEILGTFSYRADAVIVGGKVVDVTGALHHGGGLIWRDGGLTIRSYGPDPAHPSYNYARPVDQVAPEFMVVRRSSFLQLGGFDEQYETPDYAVADLCLAVRAGGGRSWYQPLASAIEYGDLPPMPGSANDGERLRQGRPQSLAQLPADPNQSGSELRDRLGQILMISQSVPTPDLDAGSVIHFEYLRLFGELGYQMSFVPEHSMADAGRHTRQLQRLGVQCIHRPHYQNLWEFARDKGQDMDMVLLCRAPLAEHYLRIISPFCDRAKVVIDCMDLHHIREDREAALLGSAEKRQIAAQTRVRELDAIRRADMTIVVSDFERDYLADKVPEADVTIVPLVLDCPGRQAEFEDLADICYIGGYRHLPNVDAVKYFASEVWPLIRGRLPGVRFRVMGSYVPPDIAALASEDIVIDGFVSDLATSVGRCRLSVAPLRFGAGIKGKVGTSLSYGVPCIASPIASEGMGLGPLDGVISADGAPALADAVVELYTNRAYWYQMSDGGMAFVRTNYSFDATRVRLRNILGRLALPCS